MASRISDFLYENDAILAVIDTNMLQNDEELNLEVNSYILSLILSSGGLKKRFMKKQSSSRTQEVSSSDFLGSVLVLTQK